MFALSFTWLFAIRTHFIHPGRHYWLPNENVFVCVCVCVVRPKSKYSHTHRHTIHWLRWAQHQVDPLLSFFPIHYFPLDKHPFYLHWQPIVRKLPSSLNESISIYSSVPLFCFYALHPFNSSTHTHTLTSIDYANLGYTIISHRRHSTTRQTTTRLPQIRRAIRMPMHNHRHRRHR